MAEEMKIEDCVSATKQEVFITLKDQTEGFHNKSAARLIHLVKRKLGQVAMRELSRSESGNWT